MLSPLLTIGLLTSCTKPSTIPTEYPQPTTTADITVVKNLAQAFISAYGSEQAGDLLALYSYEAIFMDNSTPYRSDWLYDLVRNSSNYVINLFENTSFGMKLDSYVVSRDGRFVVLTGTYTNIGKDGNLSSVPITIILEVKDGEIIREDQYYDNSSYY
jgi:ketosteroid isomerase-like protein